MKKNLVIFGTGTFAKVAWHYFSIDSDYRVVGFTVDRAYLTEPEFQDLPVVPFESLDSRFAPDEHDIFVAVGLADMNSRRKQKVEEVKGHGFGIASFVSSRAMTPPEFTARENTMIMESCVVMPGVSVGRNTIIWPGSTIGVDSQIGDHCWLVAATLGERVVMGESTFAGIRSVICPKTTIGRQNLIGAGALVMHDTNDFAVFRGAHSKPARARSTRMAKLLT